MPELPHLILPRAEVEMERRKRPGFGQTPKRNVGEQTERVRQAVDDALAVHTKLRSNIIDPALIVRVRTNGVVPEEEWERAGLAVLGHDAGGSVVLFVSDAELQEFRSRLIAFSAGTKEGQKNPSYNTLIASIEEFGPLKPEDRIGSALQEEGFNRSENFADDRGFIVDVELWDIGTQADRGQQADRMAEEILGLRGEVSDRYIGITFSALRVLATGNVIRRLLDDPLVRLVDLPPQLDLDVAPLLDATIADFGTVEPPDEDAPLVAIIDTGVNSAHPLLEPVVVDRAASPDTLGLSDVYGHGSRVSGIAAYGDVGTCAMRLKAYRGTHIERLYQRLASGKGHGRAIVAVARHLAEASYWVLRKRQPYKSPGPQSAITGAA